MHRGPLLGTVLMALAAVARPAGAQLFQTEAVKAELVSEVRSIEPGVPFWVGLSMKTAPGWHLNWINPGDAGLAPTVAWTLPEGFEAGNVQWPYPERFVLPELTIFGYKGEVCLLVEIRPPRELSGEVTLRARVDWLACREACVPGGADLVLSLPVKNEAPSRDEKWTQVFNETRNRLPACGCEWGFDASLTDRSIVLDVAPPDGWTDELTDLAFYPVDQGVIENNAPQELAKTGDDYRLLIERARMSGGTPKRVRGVLVSANGWGNGSGKAIAIDIPLNEQ